MVQIRTQHPLLKHTRQSRLRRRSPPACSSKKITQNFEPSGRHRRSSRSGVSYSVFKVSVAADPADFEALDDEVRQFSSGLHIHLQQLAVNFSEHVLRVLGMFPRAASVLVSCAVPGITVRAASSASSFSSLWLSYAPSSLPASSTEHGHCRRRPHYFAAPITHHHQRQTRRNPNHHN